MDAQRSQKALKRPTSLDATQNRQNNESHTLKKARLNGPSTFINPYASKSNAKHKPSSASGPSSITPNHRTPLHRLEPNESSQVDVSPTADYHAISHPPSTIEKSTTQLSLFSPTPLQPAEFSPVLSTSASMQIQASSSKLTRFSFLCFYPHSLKNSNQSLRFAQLNLNQNRKRAKQRVITFSISRWATLQTSGFDALALEVPCEGQGGSYIADPNSRGKTFYARIGGVGFSENSGWHPQILAFTREKASIFPPRYEPRDAEGEVGRRYHGAGGRTVQNIADKFRSAQRAKKIETRGEGDDDAGETKNPLQINRRGTRKVRKCDERLDAFPRGTRVRP
ncbi:hypothetical protein B0H14DRAFT_2626189 [Mycena olivaceomarginata]|nr:hypothetical protein B0H14DRAFT_2626189 [Mycena olivaceomarginata]